MRISLFVLLLYTNLLFGGNENYLCGARIMGMANAGVALKDPFSFSHNQAGLINTSRPTFTTSYENLYSQTGLAVKSFSAGTLLLDGVFNLNTTLYGNNNYSENKYGLAYSKAFGGSFCFGLQFDAISTNIEEYGSKTQYTGEAGFIAKLSDKISIGGHAYNPFLIKLSSDDNELPTSIFCVGAAIQVSDKVLCTAETEKDIRYEPSFKAGIEYSPHSSIFIRSGVNSLTESFSLGLGCLVSQFKIDIAAKSHPQLGIGYQLSLQYVLP